MTKNEKNYGQETEAGVDIKCVDTETKDVS